MDEKEQEEVTIVVYVGETELEYVLDISKQIQQLFADHCESGMIEVISPPASYYPNMNELRLTLNDTSEQVKWRSKLVLDYAFLMNYSMSKAMYFLQLEDDLITKKNYVTKMKLFIEASNNKKTDGPWFMLEFCRLGSIAKLFNSEDLPALISFYKAFFNDQPVDWLMDLFLNVKYCGYIYADANKCIQEKRKYRLTRSTSLFQHVGKISSQKGKIQPLEDFTFNLPD